MRYSITKGNKEIGQATTIAIACEVIGCTTQHFYKTQVDGIVNYKKETYKVLDKVTQFKWS